jgi:hypothetical protein
VLYIDKEATIVSREWRSNRYAAAGGGAGPSCRDHMGKLAFPFHSRASSQSQPVAVVHVEHGESFHWRWGRIEAARTSPLWHPGRPTSATHKSPLQCIFEATEIAGLQPCRLSDRVTTVHVSVGSARPTRCPLLVVDAEGPHQRLAL